MPTNPSAITIHSSFPRFRPGQTDVPVWCVTPHEGRCIHRFFDTSPMSPSGRYMAVFRMPTEERMPQPGDAGEVVLIDLRDGGEKVVATTRGWETQMGCNLNWAGQSTGRDEALVFNDVDTDTWTPMVVKLNPLTGESQRWRGGVYQVSPDGRIAASASMEKMRRTQMGYGVLLPDEHVGRNVGAPADDGLFFVDLQTGQRKLVLSLADAVQYIPDLRDLSKEQLAEWEIYGFHCKWCPDGHRMIFTIRRYPNPGANVFNAFARDHRSVRFDVLTLRPDGTDIHDAVPAKYWEFGGHHINFFPNGDKLSMNLGYFRAAKYNLVQVNYDGSDLGKIIETIHGSGHPTVHPDGRHILTDTYAQEGWTREGMTPLRWIDVKAGTEREVVRLVSQPKVQPDGALRVDPHPAWDRSWRWVAFNAVVDGVRRVMIADFGGLLAPQEPRTE